MIYEIQHCKNTHMHSYHIDRRRLSRYSIEKPSQPIFYQNVWKLYEKQYHNVYVDVYVMMHGWMCREKS